MKQNYKISVAYQGLPGAYSDIASQKYFKNKAKTCPKNTFTEIFKAVKNKKCGFAMVPIENSIAGSVYQNYDLLAQYNLYIVGEIYLRICHNLLAVPIKNKTKEERLGAIKKVYSHPVALAQCQKFFNKHPWLKAVSSFDTAGSAKELAQKGNKNTAVIASSLAAKIYGLEIIKQKIETNKNNFTRFVVVSQKQKVIKPNKVSLIFSTNHKPGSLYQALKPFAQRKINLTKIESRPIIGQLWEYVFYLDFEISSIKKCQQAIKELKTNCLFLKILGFYQKGKTVKS